MTGRPGHSPQSRAAAGSSWVSARARSPDGIAGTGGPRRSPREGLQALSEAIDIIRASWAGQTVGYDGYYYQVSDLKPGPGAEFVGLSVAALDILSGG